MAEPRPSIEVLRSTRTGLHAVAEGVLAGPQHRTSGTIRLSVVPGAVETVASPHLRLTATAVSGPGGDASLLDGTTVRALGAAVGVPAGPPDGVYPDTSGVDVDQALSIDADTASALMDWFSVGAAGLLRFAPGTRAVLWPEHFDLAITLDEVNYGVSPGDGFSPVPYAYVGPHRRVEDPFFGAPFGAVRTWEEASDARSLAAFFAEGRDRAQKQDPQTVV